MGTSPALAYQVFYKGIKIGFGGPLDFRLWLDFLPQTRLDEVEGGIVVLRVRLDKISDVAALQAVRGLKGATF